MVAKQYLPLPDDAIFVLLQSFLGVMVTNKSDLHEKIISKFVG